MIEAGTEGDLGDIMELISAAIRGMSDAGIEQWDGIYPDQEVIAYDLARKTLFKCTEQGKIAAIVVLDGECDPLYETVDWGTESRQPLFVHRLCVSPLFQGRGIAKRMMRFAEYLAVARGHDTVRLDAFTRNPAALKLYDGLSYRRAGTVNLRKGLFYCFEKRIPPPPA